VAVARPFPGGLTQSVPGARIGARGQQELHHGRRGRTGVSVYGSRECSSTVLILRIHTRPCSEQGANRAGFAGSGSQHQSRRTASRLLVRVGAPCEQVGNKLRVALRSSVHERGQTPVSVVQSRSMVQQRPDHWEAAAPCRDTQYGAALLVCVGVCTQTQQLLDLAGVTPRSGEQQFSPSSSMLK